jgi:hypothetical protein
MSPIIEDPEGFFANLVPRRDDLLVSLERVSPFLDNVVNKGTIRIP